MRPDNWDNFERDATSLVSERLPQLDEERPVWIYGAGAFARSLYSALLTQGFDVKGFLETKPTRASLMDLPVLALASENIPREESQIAVGIFNRETSFAHLARLAREVGYEQVFLPHELYPRLKHQLGWRYWMSEKEAILKDLSQLRSAYDLFADQHSRDRFLRILSFRLGIDEAYADVRDEEPQYINSLTLPHLDGRTICLMDGGAFDGDSFRQISKETTIGEAFLFEPDAENYRRLTVNMKGMGAGVCCMPFALSDRYKMLSFTGGQGESAAINDSGTNTIAAISLDEVFPNKQIDFLKLDIEGSEAAAIEGARSLLIRSRPVVAMSLYHKTHDLWHLPKLLHEILPNHSLHILQHMFNSFESVLYALPRASPVR